MTYTLGRLVEWRSPDFQSFQPLELWIMLLVVAAVGLGWRLPLTRALMLLLLLHMALKHTRFTELVGLVGPLLAAPALAAQLGGGSSGRLDRMMAALAKPARAAGVGLAGLILLGITGLLLRDSAARQPAWIRPEAALAAVKANHVEGQVLNDYEFGGYLIFSGIAPFIDGRAELYGDAFIERYGKAMLLQSDQLPQLLREYGITWTLIAPERPAVLLLDRLSGWRRLYADDVAVVHVPDDRSTR